MSWRDRMRPASFRGVPFYVDAIRTSNVIYGDEQVFPGRATAGAAVHVESMGRGPQRFSIQAFVASADYDRARDALEDALMTPGPGTLVHPYRGTFRVSVTPRSVTTTESSRSEGYAQIRFEVVVVDDPAPRAPVAVDTSAARSEASAAVVAGVDVDALVDAPDSVGRSALATFDVGVSAAYKGHRAFARTLRIADEVGRRTTEVSELASAFASAPGDALATAAATIDGLVSTVVVIADATDRAWEGLDAIYQALKAALTDDASKRPATRTDELAVRTQIGDALTGTWIASAGDALTRAPHASRQGALAARSWWLGVIDGWLGTSAAGTADAAGTASYAAMVALRAAVADEMNLVARGLPDVEEHELLADQPALVVAHDVYGDATRDCELLERSPQSTPDLIPAGTTVEVLS